MFLWARLPRGISAVDLLPHAVDKGVGFVPGAPFYTDHGDARTLRLSFVTPSVEEIHTGGGGAGFGFAVVCKHVDLKNCGSPLPCMIRAAANWPGGPAVLLVQAP